VHIRYASRLFYNKQLMIIGLQVANLADCVKVAIDFVSPENVVRCELLTREFREQNQGLKWKEDVLQLKTMMWFAWLSCTHDEEKAD
jgi:lysine-specific demethylase 3